NATTEAGTAFELRLGQHDGSHVPIIARAAPVSDRSGTVHGVVEILTEIGGLLARDPVTRLPTQTLFLDRLEQAFTAELGPVAVLAVVLDRFDLARAALAPAVVDDVLRRAAELLTQQVDQLSDQIDV